MARIKRFWDRFNMTRHTKDTLRLLATVGIGWLFLHNDVGSNVILSASAIMVLTVGMAHLLRRIMFSSIDLAETAREAVRNKNMSAAIIFASVCITLCTWSMVMVTLLK